MLAKPTAGVIANYTSTTINAPEGIAAGPDKALWFTDGFGRIKVTPPPKPKFTSGPKAGYTNGTYTTPPVTLS